jgi:hypothetical protein
MPDPAGQIFKPIIIPELAKLPLEPPLLVDFEPTPRLSRERLDYMLATIPEGFLSKREVDLLVFVIRTRENAFAFNDTERGTFSPRYFPDYEIPVIEHTPWVQPPIRVPTKKRQENMNTQRRPTALGYSQYRRNRDSA